MRALGIILAGGHSDRLKDLSDIRAIAAMPIGSNYRAIDFTLSNMANSNINKIAVITQYNPRSLNDHLSAAKWWNLGSKNGGLFVFSPYLSKDNSYWYRGTAESIYQNMSFLEKSNEDYVIIASGDAISKMDFHDMLNYHIEKGADITVICKDLTNTNMDPHSFGIMEFDDDMRMIDFEEKPVEPQTNIASLGIYIVKRTLLIKLLETAMAEDRHDFVNDIVSRYRKKLKIYGYLYDGYWKTLNSLKSYVEINMDFLNKDIRRKFIFEKPYIMTKPKDEPPVKYNSGASVKNSLIGSGSIINSYVADSVLFRKVFVGDGSSVVNSVVLEGSVIGKGCDIKNAIIDKNVVISDGKKLIGTPEEPVIIAKGTVL